MKKQWRDIEKAKGTFAGKCGVRNAGMQSLKGPTQGDLSGALEFRNKYDGRKLQLIEFICKVIWCFPVNFQNRADFERLILSGLCKLEHFVLITDHLSFILHPYKLSTKLHLTTVLLLA